MVCPLMSKRVPDATPPHSAPHADGLTARAQSHLPARSLYQSTCWWRGVGGQRKVFKLPGLAKIAVRKKPATKARMGRNPATGEPMMFKAKPASKKVKITPLKNLKEAAGAK